jgi:hypothetical protein
MNRFQVRRSLAICVVQARGSLDKTQVMLSTDSIKAIAKFNYLLTTKKIKPDRNILLGCCSHFIALIYLFVIYLMMLFLAHLTLNDTMTIE